MEGEKYNLAKVHEEAEKLQQKVKSGDAPNYGETEKLVDKESAVIQNLEQIISQKGFYPEALITESGLSEAELNKYLVEIWISGRQDHQMPGFLDYVGKHKENFTGIGSLPEGETPYPVKSLFEETVKSKKPISEALSMLRDIFQIDDQKLRDIIADTYQYYAGNQYQTTVFQALQKEFPLTTEESEHIALALISKKLEYAEKTFTSNDSRGKFDFQSFNLIKQQFPEIARILDRPEITTTGKKLIKEMLNYAGQHDKSGLRDPKAVILQIVRLRELAPQFFQDDFSEEVSRVWNRVVEYGSFGRTKYGGVDKMSKLLSVLDYPVEKTKPMARETLLEKLSSGSYPEGLIEYTKRFGMDDLLADPEIINSAKEGRRKALFSLHEESFQEFSNGFGFSEDWRSDPELIIVVRDGILKRFEGYNDFDEIERMREAWCIPQIADDEKIKTTVRDKITVGPYSPVGDWKKKLQTFNNWGIPLDSLRDHAKQYILGELNKEGDKLYPYRVEECTRVFPEVMDSPDMQEIVTRRVLDWKYEKKSHGYYQLGKTISEILRVIKDLRLRPELLDQWKASIATKLLADVKDQKQFKEFQEDQRYLKLPPDILKGVAVNSSLISLSQGEPGNALFLEKQFSIKLSEANEKQLKRAGETGLTMAFQQGNLQNAIKIQEICHLPPELFAQPEVNNKISQLLADQFLCRGEFKDLQEKIDLFGLSSETYPIMDTHASNNEQLSGNLTKFIKYLGNEDIVAIFPQTFERVREMIFAKLAEDQDLADYFVENLGEYYQQPWVAENVTKAIQQYSVAQKFVYAVDNDQTIWKDEPWVVDIFSKAKTVVEEHKKQWQQDDDQQQDEYGYSHGNEGFSETDPFENHPWRFGGRQIRIASAISELMAGKANTQEFEKLGINANEISPLLAEANEKVNTAYQNFLEQIRSNTSIKDEDKQALLEPESSSVKMTSLLNNTRSFVARYFVQSVEGDVTRLSEIGNLSGELDRILAEGFKRYIKIHEVDVPLYDKLYEEFDTLRETGRSPLEVYLGRDGIYAYIGRHAQDVARRRKLGLEGRKKLKEMGEVVEIHPQYTVYPRYFRDNINQETKRQFLEQEGISPDADPLFYDTGYTGTIPEQIMKVMDFSQEDIERRIRLLSAPSVHRRVKGIPKNARSEIIEYIEHNAKTEETAEGLIIDEKTGKIRHIARPTNPEEQFYFMMVKQAVARHYWLQEQLHHEPSGNVNLDSEHYTIRIRQEYAKLLPSDFMQNPKEFLTQHGEMLKGSKGEGEYPDEEVVLFKMTDGTEIVAKKIELRKAKEARKEFSILISAKKAGLPTAEPVGFLSGKEESDGSYLLMKKLEGISGRNFDKYLRDSGKFTEEKIKSILQQVAEKNKEMAELFRTTLKIDKRWRIKDTIIELNEETGEVENVTPIDWERAQNFNPATPKEIDEIA